MLHSRGLICVMSLCPSPGGPCTLRGGLPHVVGRALHSPGRPAPCGRAALHSPGQGVPWRALSLRVRRSLHVAGRWTARGARSFHIGCLSFHIAGRSFTHMGSFRLTEAAVLAHRRRVLQTGCGSEDGHPAISLPQVSQSPYGGRPLSMASGVRPYLLNSVQR